MADEIYDAYIEYSLYGETYRTNQVVKASSERTALGLAQHDFIASHVEECRIEKISVEQREK